MATTDLGACEWFVWDLRRSNLIDRGQLDQVVGEFLKKQPRAEPPALADYLVGQGVLTQFQSERILQGKTQGLVLGPYTLMDAIGSGSMGTVYKAFSKTDSKWYAVKVLPRRSMWNVRLARRQVRQFEQFNSPSVVPFVDVGTSGGLHYLAWPLVEGENMEAVVQREGKMDPGMAAQYILQTATGLAACHHHGIFHGLLKPSNMMLGPDGQVHILDYGIGSLLAENEGESLVDTMSTANTMTSGLDCASPESIMEPTNRTAAGDQYSLGCCLYFFLTGKYPFPEGSAVEKMMAHQYKQPTPIKDLVPDVPDELVEVAERLMQKTPEGRYSNSDEITEALRPHATAIAPRPAAARSTGVPGGLRRGDNGAPSSKPGMGPRPADGPPPRGSAPAKGNPPPGKGSSPSLRPPATPSGMPARKSLRDSIASPAAPKTRDLPPEDDEEQDPEESNQDEDEDEDDEDEEDEDDAEDSNEPRINTTVVTILAVVVTAVVFWVAMRLFSGDPILPWHPWQE